MFHVIYKNVTVILKKFFFGQTCILYFVERFNRLYCSKKVRNVVEMKQTIVATVSILYVGKSFIVRVYNLFLKEPVSYKVRLVILNFLPIFILICSYFVLKFCEHRRQFQRPCLSNCLFPNAMSAWIKTKIAKARDCQKIYCCII